MAFSSRARPRQFLLFTFLLLAPLTYAETNCDIYVESLKIEQLQSGTGGPLTPALLQKVIPPVQFANPDKHSWSCIDGRETEAIFGTPGGDSGELLLGLSAFQQMGGRLESFDDVEKLFDEFLITEIESPRDFYMHTDHDAVELIRDSLNIPMEEQQAFDIERVPAKYQAAALDLLVNPGPSPRWYIGCGHLRLAITDPEAYRSSKIASQGLIRAFFKSAWDETKPSRSKLRLAYEESKRPHSHVSADHNGITEDLKLPQLEGAHKEMAVVIVSTAHSSSSSRHVKVSRECERQLLESAPLITPLRHHKQPLVIDSHTSLNFTSFFTVHDFQGRQPLISSFRRQIAEFFARKLPHGAKASNEVFVRMNELALLQFNLTATRLHASTKPIFHATITLAAREVGSHSEAAAAQQRQEEVIAVVGSQLLDQDSAAAAAAAAAAATATTTTTTRASIVGGMVNPAVGAVVQDTAAALSNESTVSMLTVLMFLLLFCLSMSCYYFCIRKSRSYQFLSGSGPHDDEESYVYPESVYQPAGTSGQFSFQSL